MQTPRDLHETLRSLREAPVPDGLAPAILARVKRERRFLGLPVSEWAVVGGALSAFGVALQIMVSWASSAMLF